MCLIVILHWDQCQNVINIYEALERLIFLVSTVGRQLFLSFSPVQKQPQLHALPTKVIRLGSETLPIIPLHWKESDSPQAVLVLCHFVPCHLQKPGGHANPDVQYQYKIYLFHIPCPEYTSSHDVNNPRTWILSKFVAMRSRVPTGSMTMLDRKRMGKSKEVWDESSKKKKTLWHSWNKWAWDAMTCCAAKRLLYLEVDDANKGWKMLNVGYLRRANVLVACKKM